MIPIPECSSRMASFIMKLVYGLEEVSFLLDPNSIDYTFGEVVDFLLCLNYIYAFKNY